jgi:hypothetical protein
VRARMAEIDRDTLPTVAEGRALAGDATGGATGAPAEAVEIGPGNASGRLQGGAHASG